MEHDLHFAKLYFARQKEKRREYMEKTQTCTAESAIIIKKKENNIIYIVSTKNPLL